jgi:hypothetical protein
MTHAGRESTFSRQAAARTDRTALGTARAALYRGRGPLGGSRRTVALDREALSQSRLGSNRGRLTRYAVRLQLRVDRIVLDSGHALIGMIRIVPIA